MKLASCEIRIKSTKSGSELVPIHSAVLIHGHTGQLPGDPTSIGAHANLCMLCTACFFLCFNTDFVESNNTINLCLILSTFTVLFLRVVV